MGAQVIDYEQWVEAYIVSEKSILDLLCDKRLKANKFRPSSYFLECARPFFDIRGLLRNYAEKHRLTVPEPDAELREVMETAKRCVSAQSDSDLYQMTEEMKRWVLSTENPGHRVE